MSFDKQVEKQENPNRVSSSLHLSKDTPVIPQHSIATKFICHEKKEVGGQDLFLLDISYGIIHYEAFYVWLLSV